MGGFRTDQNRIFMTTKQQKRTDISTLGEFGLIERLTADLKTLRSTTMYGVGDDAAVLDPGGQMILISTDLLLEGIHFSLVYTPLKHLGYKSVVVNLSDIYAMNAEPTQVTVSIGVSSRFCLEDLEEFYNGIKLACQSYNVDLVGGDTSSSLTGLNISVTVIGTALKEDLVFRKGASEHDLICVSGDLGGAYMGLQLLERERKLFEEEMAAQKSLEGHEFIIARQLKPEARGDIIKLFKEHDIKPTAMIDLSDGLSSDLLHITRACGLGCHIYADKIPIADATRQMAEEFKIEPLIAALNGGEDYELLFTIAPDDYEKVQAIQDVRIIGHMTHTSNGNKLMAQDGTAVNLQAQGWKHME